MKRKNSWETLQWLCRVSGKEKWNIVFLVLVQTFLGVSTVLFVWLLRGGIDYAVEKNKEGFSAYAISMIAVILLQILANALKRFYNEYAVSGMENCFKSRLFGQLLTRDYAHIMTVHSGEWMNRLTSDVVVVAEGMTVILPDVIGMLVKLIGAVIALLVLVPEMGFLIIAGGIFLLVFSTASRRVLKRLHVGIQEADGKLRVQLSEQLSGMLIVRTFARERQTLEEAEEQMQRLAIARAIYSGNPILVLDEATSALDEATEQRLVINLKQMTEYTILLVTHRSAMLQLCNQQVVLKNN